MLFRKIIFFILFLETFGLHAQNLLDTEVATRWVELELQFLKTTNGITPPIASRTIAYQSLVLYESVVHGLNGYQSLVGQLNDFQRLPLPAHKNLHWSLCANAAQAKLLNLLLPQTSDNNKEEIKKLKQYFEDKYNVPKNIAKQSEKFGEEIALAIYAYSKKDGGHESYLNNFPKDYKITAGACNWVPTNEQKIPLLPYWGQNRAFLKANANIILPLPPRCTADQTSDLYKQALEVYQIKKNLSAEQKEIALFWSDAPKETPTPSGHLLSITTQLIKREKLGLDKAAELYAKIGIASADAFILCWKCKYLHNILRPVTYIRTVIEPNWTPFLNTPDFPEYTSGHSSVSSAVAQILADTFGGSYTFTDNTYQNRNFKPRTFSSFELMAQEAANSRLYGGIHYQNSNDQGLASGKIIGQNICALRFKRK